MLRSRTHNRYEIGMQGSHKMSSKYFWERYHQPCTQMSPWTAPNSPLCHRGYFSFNHNSYSPALLNPYVFPDTSTAATFHMNEVFIQSAEWSLHHIAHMLLHILCLFFLRSWKSKMCHQMFSCTSLQEPLQWHQRIHCHYPRFKRSSLLSMQIYVAVWLHIPAVR